MLASRNWGCRASLDHEIKGYRALVLQNDLLRVTALLGKGGDIVEFLHKPSDTDCMGWTLEGLVPKGQAGLAFGDNYQGGWQEIFPNGGAACRHQGIAYGVHEESAQQAWDGRIREDSPGRVEVEISTTTRKSGLRCVKRLSMKKGVSALFIEETMTNAGTTPRDFIWGHHPLFSAPFLSPDCRLDLKGATAEFHAAFAELPRFAEGTEGRWPRLKGLAGKPIDLSRFPVLGPESQDMFYLKALKGNWYALTNAKKKAGFGLAWDLKTFPYLWYWQVFKKGRYHAAIEPFSSIPSGLANAVERGTQLSLKPGATRKTWLTAVAYSGKARVKNIARGGLVS